MAAKKTHHDDGEHFVRAGRHVISLNHVVSVELPVDGDETKTLQMKLTTGENFTVSGDESDAVMDALGECCNVDPEKAKKKAAK